MAPLAKSSSSSIIMEVRHMVSSSLQRRRNVVDGNGNGEEQRRGRVQVVSDNRRSLCSPLPRLFSRKQSPPVYHYQQTGPASAWSCSSSFTKTATTTILSKSVPPSAASSSPSLSLSLSTSSTHSTTSSISSHDSSGSNSTTTTGQSSQPPRRRTSLTALHAVGGSFRAILLFLEKSGVSRASILELQHMILAEQYLQVMERAEEYVDCLLTLEDQDFDITVIGLLLEAVWTSLRDYSRSLYKEAQMEYSRYQNKHYEEMIVQQGLTERQREQRQQRRLAEFDKQHEIDLRARVQTAIRFKIDCEKGLLQTTREWTRYLRAQQRQQQQQKSQQQ